MAAPACGRGPCAFGVGGGVRGPAGALLAGAVVAGALLFGGCSDEPDGPTLQDPSSDSPTSSASSAPPTEAPTVSAEEQAVLDAYRGFYAALDQAQADPARSQEYLEPVATGAQFETTNAAVKANLIAGVESFGSPVLNPVVASIEGTTAVVQDCQDTSGVGTRRIGTTEPLTIGRNPDSAETTLQLVDGAWRVAATSFPEQPEVFCR